MRNCANCSRPNGILNVGSEQCGQTTPLCIDCYEKLQTLQLNRLYQYSYLAWEADEQMNSLFEGFGVPVHRRPPPTAPSYRMGGRTINNINVSGSQIGAVNTGSMHSFAVNVSQLKRSGNPQLASEMNTLMEQVVTSDQFSTAIKQEIVEALDFLAEQAATATEARKSSMTKTIMARLDDLLIKATSVNGLWTKIRDLLLSIL